jgi:GNAT superfamily N-acetyltransferase
MSREDLTRRIAEAYRWQRRLGADVIETPFCRIVADPTKPAVWNCNHADEVTAQSADEIDAVFAAMEQHLAHTRWRAVYTDAFTPDPFLARLAFSGFRERPLTVQMALEGEATNPGAEIDLRAVESEADWAALLELVLADHAEGRATGGLEIGREVSEAIVANYRAKSPACRFHLAREGGDAIAYGASAAAPNGLGMIEDLFTLPQHRRRGVASGMIAAFVADLRGRGCDTVFLGALADETAKFLYHRLGFQAVALARGWVKEVG